MGILDLHREGIEQSLQWELAIQKIETARLIEECNRISGFTRKLERRCIELDDPFRPTPEQWHWHFMRDASSWIIVVVVPLLFMGALRRRLRWSWAWAAAAVVMSSYASVLGVGYATYYFFKVEHLLSAHLVPKAIVGVATIVASGVVFFVGLAFKARLTRAFGSIANRSPLHRVRLLVCVLATFAALASALLSLMDGSWARHLAWVTQAYGAHGHGESTILLFLWATGVLLGALILPPIYGLTIGRLSCWIRSGT